MNTPKRDTKISFLSGISSLFEHARNGRIDIASEIMVDLKGKLSSLPPEFAVRQQIFLSKIEEQYALGQDGKSFEPVSAIPVDKVEQKLKPGVSLVAACMNRQQNLLKVLPTWLATEADEIIIVDWSSRDELWPMLENFHDSRLKVIRIDDEPRWILTHALNLGLREAQHEIIYKFDADISITPDFISKNQIHPGEFIRGFWKQAVDAGQDDQKYVNGTFGAYKKDLMSIGYYDERIVTYGWDDSDIYTRLCMDLGLAGRLLDQSSVRHLEQEETQRTENQDVNRHLFLETFGPTELEGAKNKFYTQLAGTWGPHSPRTNRFQFVQVQECMYRGHRITPHIPVQPELLHLAEVFAARMFVEWKANLPPSLRVDSKYGLEISRLFRDVHSRGMSAQLKTALLFEQNLHFVRVPPGPLRAALFKTLGILSHQRQAVTTQIFVVESDVPLENPIFNPANIPGILAASDELIVAMAESCRSKDYKSIKDLEKVFIGDVQKSCCITVSRELLRDEILAKADEFIALYGRDNGNSIEPWPGSCLVTSLYDEKNLIRLIDYLSCVVLNLRVFERIIVAYESDDGLLLDILSLLSVDLQLPIGRLQLTPFKKRPTFEELFSVKSGLPDGTVLAVANADIVFDHSARKLDSLALDTHMAVLSRWDINDEDGSASLIRLENGAPNTFSADAWIVRTPFDPDFYLDYPIGTMHCDSFINNQLSRSKRYGIVNPCLDVHIFHLHDDRFNSWQEKRARDQVEIQSKYALEKERNDGLDPVKGAIWSSTGGAMLLHPNLRFQTWRPKVLALNWASVPPTLGHLLFLHALCAVVKDIPDTVIVIRLQENDVLGTLGNLLMRFKAHFSLAGLELDIYDEKVEARVSADPAVLTRKSSCVEALEWMQNIAPGTFPLRIHQLLVFPTAGNINMLRMIIDGDFKFEKTMQLIAVMQKSESHLLVSFQEFFNLLPTYTTERNILTPFIPDMMFSPVEPDNASTFPRVTLVTSLFRGGDLLPGYLDNALVAARIINGEVIIIDANPDETDGRVIKNYLDNHPDSSQFIRYLHLDNDPGLYNCWRIAIEQARAPLISNANLDDKRSPLHTARLVDLLERHPEYAGACGSITCIHREPESDWYRLLDNQIWFFGEGSREIGFGDLYRTGDSGEILSRNVMHCVPVWRKSLHDKHGFFDEEKYGTSADWAFWLHCTKAGERFYFEEEAFGRYFLNPESHNRRNDADGKKERRILKDYIGLQQELIVKQ